MSRRTPFAALLSSYVISVAGTSMSAIAVPWLVLATTGSAAKTGLVAFAQMAPYVAAQALGGPLVDRIGLRRTFIWGNAMAALAVGAIPAGYALGALSLPTLIMLVAVAGTIRGAADCANGALVPATAEHADIPLERAAGLNSSANRTAQLLGAPLAGVLVTLAGSPIVVAIDAATFAVAAAIAALWVRLPSRGAFSAGVPAPVLTSPPTSCPEPAATAAPTAEPTTASVPEPSATYAARPTAVSTAGRAAASTGVSEGVSGRQAAGGSMLRRYGRELADGMRFIRGDRLLLGIIAMVAITNLLDQGLSEVILPVWAREQIGSASALGLVVGAAGVGSLLGNLLGAWLGPKLPRRALYSVGYLLSGAPRFLVLALSGTLAPVVAVTLLSEVFGGSLNSVLGATAYERIPEHLRTRVLGTIRASAWIGIPIGALVAGYTVEALDTRLTLLAFGAVYLLTTLAPFVFPSWRQMRRPAPAPREAVTA